jgi:hypothetical protein
MICLSSDDRWSSSEVARRCIRQFIGQSGADGTEELIKGNSTTSAHVEMSVDDRGY